MFAFASSKFFCTSFQRASSVSLKFITPTLTVVTPSLSDDLDDFEEPHAAKANVATVARAATPKSFVNFIFFSPYDVFK